MKILLAGFREEQFLRLCGLFPDVRFLSSDQADLETSQAEAFVSVNGGAFDKLFTSGFIARCPNLRWVHIPNAGIDAYLSQSLVEARFSLTNGSIIQGPQVADHAMALLLSLTRGIAHIVKGLPLKTFPAAIELQGKSALVIGLGGVGMCIAERAAAFGMQVSAVTDRNFPYVSFVKERYFSDQLLMALPKADIAFMAAPLTASSRQLLSTAAFEAMKPSAYLINVSRGGTVDTQALVVALEEGRFAGVGLDVTDPEPLPDNHPLRGFDRVIVTPHVAGRSDGLGERNFELIVTNIRRFTHDLPLINVVDKTAGF